MTELYRGLEIFKGSDGSYHWYDLSVRLHKGFKTVEQAMDAIDAQRRELRAQGGAS